MGKTEIKLIEEFHAAIVKTDVGGGWSEQLLVIGETICATAFGGKDWIEEDSDTPIYA